MLFLGGLLSSESFIFLRQMWPWQRCEIAPLFSRAEVYVWRHRSVTWALFMAPADGLTTAESGWQNASTNQHGPVGVGRDRRMTSDICWILLTRLTKNTVSPSAGSAKWRTRQTWRGDAMEKFRNDWIVTCRNIIIWNILANEIFLFIKAKVKYWYFNIPVRRLLGYQRTGAKEPNELFSL